MSRERVSASAFGRVLRFLLMFWLAAHGKAQQLPDTGPPVRMDQVKSGTLLLSTDKPGVFLPAPALDTEVVVRVTGIVARASVRQKFANASNECVEGVYVFPLPEAYPSALPGRPAAKALPDVPGDPGPRKTRSAPLPTLDSE